MPAHAPLTEEQRFLIAFAVLDDDFTVAEVVEAATRGELGAAFTISPSSAYRIVAAERARRRPLVDVFDHMMRGLLELCTREVARLRGLPALGADEVRIVRELTELASDARTLIGEAAALARDGQGDDIARLVAAIDRTEAE